MTDDQKFRQYIKTGHVGGSNPAYLKYKDGKLQLMFIAENGHKSFDPLDERFSDFINKPISIEITEYKMEYNLKSLKDKAKNTKGEINPDSLTASLIKEKDLVDPNCTFDVVFNVKCPDCGKSSYPVVTYNTENDDIKVQAFGCPFCYHEWTPTDNQIKDYLKYRNHGCD